MDYISIAHPGLSVEYVLVEIAEGKGSGPGRSLFECREHLKDSFYIVCSDTMWKESFDQLDKIKSVNWIGSANLPREREKSFCNLAVDASGLVTGIYDKTENPHTKSVAFVGLAFIHNSEAFFKNFSTQEINGEVQISNGFASLLLEDKIQSLPIDWTDTGTERDYRRVSSAENRKSKYGETTYFVGRRVIKFFKDPKIVEKRAIRSSIKPNVFPEGIIKKGSFLAYDYLPGDNMYAHGNPETFAALLGWMESDVWDARRAASLNFLTSCRDFYVKKTLQRLAQFEAHFGSEWFTAIGVDGVECRNLRDKISSLGSDDFSHSQPSFIHGDFTLANVIYEPKSEGFKLIDWRQDFAESLDVGDICLDFAKMMISIMVKLETVVDAPDQFWKKSGDNYETVPVRIEEYESYLEILRICAERRGISLDNLKIYTALSLLSMAGVHLGQVGIFYYLLGARIFAEYDSVAVRLKTA